jgi:hypothetical protein
MSMSASKSGLESIVADRGETWKQCRKVGSPGKSTRGRDAASGSWCEKRRARRSRKKQAERSSGCEKSGDQPVQADTM